MSLWLYGTRYRRAEALNFDEILLSTPVGSQYEPIKSIIQLTWWAELYRRPC